MAEVHEPSEGAGPSTAVAPNPATGLTENSEEQRAKEDAILDKATAIKAQWRLLSCAFLFPTEEPIRPHCHWDYVLREGEWMAEDFMQERLWKQAAAVRFAKEAARFDRRLLKPTKTKVLRAVSLADEEFGHVVPDGKPDFPVASQGTTGKEDLAGPVTPPQEFEFPAMPYLVCPEDFMEAVIQQLEEEDVARLTQHAVAVATYNATYEAVRYLQPPEDEDPAAAASRKAAQQKRRGIKPGALLIPNADEEVDLGGGLPTGGLTSTKAMRRAAAAGGTSTTARGAVDHAALAPDEPLASIAAGREKRKRKIRDFGDDDDYGMGLSNKVVSTRDKLTRMGTRSSIMERDAGVGSEIRRPGAGMALPPKQSKLPGAVGTKGPTGLPRLDSLQRMPSMQGRGSGMMRGGSMHVDRMVSWTHQDDQVLAAIVCEFGQNWVLVADILRSASSMTGHYRRPDACKVRYVALQRSAQIEAAGGDPNDQREDITVNLQHPLMTKSQAKEILSLALPVHLDVLRRHQEFVSRIAANAKQKRAQERLQTRESHKFRADQHPSHYKAQQAVMQTTGRVLTPLEINPIEQAGAPGVPAIGQAAAAPAPQPPQPPPPQLQPTAPQQQQQPPPQQPNPAALALQQQQQQAAAAAGINPADPQAAAAAAMAAAQAQAQMAAAAAAAAGATASGMAANAAAANPALTAQAAALAAAAAAAGKASLAPGGMSVNPAGQFPQQQQPGVNGSVPGLQGMPSMGSGHSPSLQQPGMNISGLAPGAQGSLPGMTPQQAQAMAAAAAAAVRAAPNQAALMQQQQKLAMQQQLAQQQAQQQQQQARMQGMPGQPPQPGQQPQLKAGMPGMPPGSASPGLPPLGAPQPGFAPGQPQQPQVNPGMPGQMPQAPGLPRPPMPAGMQLNPQQQQQVQQQAQQQRPGLPPSAPGMPPQPGAAAQAGAPVTGSQPMSAAQIQAAQKQAAAASAAAAQNPAALQAFQAKLAAQQGLRPGGLQGLPQGMNPMGQAMQPGQQQPGPAPGHLMPAMPGNAQALWQQQAAAAAAAVAQQQQQQQQQGLSMPMPQQFIAPAPALNVPSRPPSQQGSGPGMPQ